jgi:hypothetical protein
VNTLKAWGYFLLSWGSNLLSLRAVAAILATFGGLWLCVEIADYFFRDTGIPAQIQHSWKLFFIIGLMAAGLQCRPRNKISYQLRGRDVSIEIFVGDLFAMPGSLVIGTNTTFDTHVSLSLISERSVQGQFTKKYYSSEDQLNRDLNASLIHEIHEDLAGHRIGKSKKYQIGTCVRLDPKGRTAYFIAISEINEHGVCSGSVEGLQIGLSKLWEFIRRRGSLDGIAMPILGTGFGRITQKREQVLHEIIRSFIAACSESILADRLTIVISPRDLVKHKISLNELDEFLKLQCRYTEFAPAGGRARGTAV